MLTICPASLEDAPAILALQRVAYASEARLYDDWNIPPLTQSLEQLQAEMQVSVVLKATVDGALVGSVRAQGVNGVVQIGRLMVEPGAQGRGIGSALLSAIEAAFPAAQQFELFTGSRSEANVRLYGRHGYRITHHQALSPNVTLVFMVKPNENPDGGGA
ncbi:GNAT family N-acetyltransferase [Allofranklinella schreckenbergeri]|uniref:GNAT family N-acetyltransferase n=1 Tax=Allofranklinella schreckenbergeri TaxID=1076744 RepID=A0A3M6Q7H5_9BURK|nr:GNAT family N-acetyltransferase [Allofranklinella schreckenbergeri]RMW98946.1 GNAT family N-acetyltransferase [Allofranklinella schreckenbergeri]